MIDPKILQAAFVRTEWARNQVQCFDYAPWFVIRNCLLEPGRQKIWKKRYNNVTREVCDEEMRIQHELECMKLVVAEYEALSTMEQS